MYEGERPMDAIKMIEREHMRVDLPKFRPGDRYLHSGVFSRNVETLSAWLAAGGGR